MSEAAAATPPTTNRPTGRQLLRSAIHRYRTKPNPNDATQIAHGAERCLEMLDSVEDQLVDMTKERDELQEIIEGCPDKPYLELLWAAYEEHLLRHEGGWAICPSALCRIAGPLFDDRREDISKHAWAEVRLSPRPIVVPAS